MRTLLAVALLLLLMSSACFLAPRSVRAARRGPSNGQQAKLARAAVVILDDIAAQVSDAPPARFQLVPYEESTLEQVVERLSAMRKPVECSSRIEASTLRLECRPLSRANRWLLSTQTALAQQQRARSGDSARLGPPSAVHVAGRLGTVILHPAEAARLDTAYLFLGNYIMSQEDVSAPEDQAGSWFIVRQYRASDITGSSGTPRHAPHKHER